MLHAGNGIGQAGRVWEHWCRSTGTPAMEAARQDAQAIPTIFEASHAVQM